MHPVADKIKMRAFEGRMEVLGMTREVSFMAAIQDDGGTKVIESSVLTISGLSMDEAWDVLSRLHGPVDVAKQADVKVLDLTKPAPKEPVKALEATKPAETKAKAPPAPKPAPKPEPASEPVEEDGGDDLDGDDMADELGTSEVDLSFIGKQDKLRAVIEHMISKGYDTVAKVIACCQKYKDKSPALIAVEGKGSFDKRIERSAEIVINGDAATG